MGKFIPSNLLLNDKNLSNNRVCDDCNEKLGNELELYLGRDTCEGGIFRERNYDKCHNNRLSITIANGKFKGLKLTYTGNMKVDPLPQIGFKMKNSGNYEFILVNHNFSLENINFKKYDLKRNKNDSKVLFIGIEYTKAAEYSKKLDMDPPKEIIGFKYLINDDQGIVCKIESVIDNIITRSMAKIAFNYLAYHTSLEIMLADELDVLRNYILTGDSADKIDYRITCEPILTHNLNRISRFNAHILILSQDELGNQIARVSLFDFITYNFFISSKKIVDKVGHFFNYNNQEITPLQSFRYIYMPENKILLPDINFNTEMILDKIEGK